MKKVFMVPVALPGLLLSPAKNQQKVGGQAVIEGVMMRGKNSVSWAVRKNEREVVVERREFISQCNKYKILSRPVFRGAITLFESLLLGYQALSRSAEIVEEEQRKTAKEEKPVKNKNRNRISERLASGASLVIALVVVFGIFMYLPMWLLSQLVPKDSALLFNTLSGILRIVFFLVYLVLISLWKEMRRLFEYHGAEHMAIFTYEAGDELTHENMRRNPTLHPRCGTSFILLVGIICIMLFSIVDALYITFIGPYPTVFARFAVHLLLVPLISGTSYEILRLSDKYRNFPYIGLLIKPGLLLQKITTRQPDDQQLEVAAKALTAVL